MSRHFEAGREVSQEEADRIRREARCRDVCRKLGPAFFIRTCWQVLLNGHNEDHLAVYRENFHWIFIRQFVREPMFYFLARAFDSALAPVSRPSRRIANPHTS